MHFKMVIGHIDLLTISEAATSEHKINMNTANKHLV